MEKERPTFDSIMRDALGGIGTSMSFTRRVMVRIETEKEGWLWSRDIKEK